MPTRVEAKWSSWALLMRSTFMSLLFAGCAGTAGSTSPTPTKETAVVSPDAAAETKPCPPSSADSSLPPLPAAALKVSDEFSRGLEKAFPAARDFAKATAGQEAAEKASVVLYALADALETIPGAAERAADHLVEARFEAKRLHRSDRTSLNVARWIKAGLAACTVGLEVLSEKNGDFDFWTSQARTSTAAIDERSSLTFQRAVVQDAIRATLDAFVVRAQKRGSSR